MVRAGKLMRRWRDDVRWFPPEKERQLTATRISHLPCDHERPYTRCRRPSARCEGTLPLDTPLRPLECSQNTPKGALCAQVYTVWARVCCVYTGVRDFHRASVCITSHPRHECHEGGEG